MNQGEIILYQPDKSLRLEVRFDGDNVWLNRLQLAELFDRDVKTIGKHINNALKEELDNVPVVAKFATTAADGKVYQTEHYNLDMVISVGFRVKSRRGIEFRRWANKVLKDYLLKGYSVNQRINQLESKIDSKFANHDRQLEELNNKIDFFVRTSLPPVEGIFFDGQIFEAYKFATDLIRSAKKSLLLIDNYVDESVLLMLKYKLLRIFHFYLRLIAKVLISCLIEKYRNICSTAEKNIIFALTISATPLYNAYQGGTYFLYTYGNIY